MTCRQAHPLRVPPTCSFLHAPLVASLSTQVLKYGIQRHTGPAFLLTINPRAAPSPNQCHPFSPNPQPPVEVQSSSCVIAPPWASDLQSVLPQIRSSHPILLPRALVTPTHKAKLKLQGVMLKTFCLSPASPLLTPSPGPASTPCSPSP